MFQETNNREGAGKKKVGEDIVKEMTHENAQSEGHEFPVCVPSIVNEKSPN